MICANTPQLSRALQVKKRALSSNSRVPFEEGFRTTAERAGKSVETNAKLRFELERVCHKMFTPTNFSDENYFNGMEMPLNNAIWEADPANGIVRSIRPMLLHGNANVTRPDDIRFMTVNTTINRGTKNISFTQSFELPQESAVITLLNGNPRHARTYTGPDPMQMTYHC